MRKLDRINGVEKILKKIPNDEIEEVILPEKDYFLRYGGICFRFRKKSILKKSGKTVRDYSCWNSHTGKCKVWIREDKEEYFIREINHLNHPNFPDSMHLQKRRGDVIRTVKVIKSIPIGNYQLRLILNVPLSEYYTIVRNTEITVYEAGNRETKLMVVMMKVGKFGKFTVISFDYTSIREKLKGEVRVRVNFNYFATKPIVPPPPIPSLEGSSYNNIPNKKRKLSEILSYDGLSTINFVSPKEGSVNGDEPVKVFFNVSQEDRFRRFLADKRMCLYDCLFGGVKSPEVGEPFLAECHNPIIKRLLHLSQEEKDLCTSSHFAAVVVTPRYEVPELVDVQLLTAFGPVMGKGIFKYELDIHEDVPLMPEDMIVEEDDDNNYEGGLLFDHVRDELGINFPSNGDSVLSTGFFDSGENNMNNNDIKLGDDYMENTERCTDCFGGNILHVKSAKGDVVAVKKLVEEKGFDPSREDIFGITPLRAAQKFHRKDVIKYLESHISEEKKKEQVHEEEEGEEEKEKEEDDEGEEEEESMRYVMSKKMIEDLKELHSDVRSGKIAEVRKKMKKQRRWYELDLSYRIDGVNVFEICAEKNLKKMGQHLLGIRCQRDDCHGKKNGDVLIDFKEKTINHICKSKSRRNNYKDVPFSKVRMKYSLEFTKLKEKVHHKLNAEDVLLGRKGCGGGCKKKCRVNVYSGRYNSALLTRKGIVLKPRKMF